MERLTFEGNFCDIAQCAETPGGSFCESGSCSQKKVWERLKEYEDTGLEPDQVKSLWTAICDTDGIPQVLWGRLCSLARADKEGRVVVLPCKIGDTVYYDTFAENATKRLGILPHEVAAVRSCVIVKGWPVSTDLPVHECGKSWFLTHEEAEAALERQKGERDHA